MVTVRPGRAAALAGVLVGVCIAALYCLRTVPDRVVSLFGGPSGGVDRWGGLRVRYQPPPGSEAAIEEYLRTQANVERDGSVLRLEFPGVSVETVPTLLDVLIAGGLSMKEALETDWAVQIAQGNELVNSDPEERRWDEPEDESRPRDTRARLELDGWHAEDGSSHSTYFLVAPTAQALDDAIANARARGYQVPPGTEILYEAVDYEMNRRPPEIRAYLVKSEVSISGRMIDRADGSYEPNTGRPIILLDFTADAGDTFCELTGRISGKKLATVLGGRIRSAPIINGPICGGRASITMGGSDLDHQITERDALVEVLRHGALPTGGQIHDKAWTPPANTFIQELIGRLFLGLLAGLVAALITFAVIRFARPMRATITHAFAGGFPWRRLLVTLLAPIALIGGSRLTLPGVEDLQLDIFSRSTDLEKTSVITLGLTPVMLGYFLVELIALAIPALRWRRHDPMGRIRLGQAVAVLAILLALAHGYFVSRSLESASYFGQELIVEGPGWRFRALIMLSVTAGTLILAVIAGAITEHGLGNGYGVLMVAGIVLDILPDSMTLDPVHHGVGLVAFVALVTAATFVLRLRVVEGREPGLRIPASGLSPLADTGAFVTLVVTLTGIAVDGLLFDLWIWTNVLHDWKIKLALVVLSVPLWAWLFARPAVIERVALQSGLERPSRRSWLRATALSGLFLIGASAVTLAMAYDLSPRVLVLINPISALLFAAVWLDMRADAHARRQPLVLAGVVHQVQYLGAVEHVLGDAQIPYHCHGAHLRTLFAFFGPWAPIHIFVPEAHALEARLKVDGVLRASRNPVPEARVHA